MGNYLRICLFVLCLVMLNVSAQQKVINIGGLFNMTDMQLRLAFQYAVGHVNDNSDILPKSVFFPRVELLRDDDSFHASKKVCSLLQEGIAGIFGPQSENNANHVQSICDAMEIPHIETRWDYKLTRDAYSINLYPHPTSLGQAYYDVLKSLKWESFVVLYDLNEALVRLQSLLKEREWTATIRQLNEGEDWRPLLKELKKSQETKFVIDVSQEILQKVLHQAFQIGLMREYHSYFITSLDLHMINIEDFRYGGTNITALRIIDPSSPNIKEMVESIKFMAMNYGLILDMKSITTEAALMYDAVHLFATALNDLDSSKEVNTSSLFCEGNMTWKHGNSLINYMKWYGSRRVDEASLPYPNMGFTPQEMPYNPMDQTNMRGGSRMSNLNRQYYVNKPDVYSPYPGSMMPKLYPMYEGQKMKQNATAMYQVEIFGLTGKIQFDTNGFRTNFELEITEIHSKDGIKKVGIWTPQGGANYTRTHKEIEEEITLNLQNRTLIVTTALTPPYTMLKETAETLVGNDRFEGFCVDLIQHVADILKFNFTMQLVADGQYGSRNKDTGEYNGMIGELLSHKADLAIVDFTITYEREEAVDFSMPFMNLGIAIIYKKPQKKAPSLFSFMSPFSVDVWIYMATAYLGVSVLLFALARITPNEWDNPHPCIQDPDELENAITLSNAFWFTIGSLMQQGSDIAPKALSTRIVAGIWWFFTLIMISSYTANLAAFLTVERMESPIEGAEDLAKQTKIKYGCKQMGSTYAFFQDSKIPTYQRMWASMSSARPTVFTTSNDDGVKRVSNSNGMYAFLMESVSIEYVIERQCDLMQVGGLLDSKSYGIALPPGSPYTGAISSAILKLKENGVIHELKTKWWKRRKGGGRCVSEDTGGSSMAAELGIPNVGGVFVVLMGGMVLSALTAICEFLWNARKLATDEHASFCEELGHEVKFIIKCSGNTKPVRKLASANQDEPLFGTYGSNYDTNYGYGPPDKKIDIPK